MNYFALYSNLFLLSSTFFYTFEIKEYVMEYNDISFIEFNDYS